MGVAIATMAAGVGTAARAGAIAGVCVLLWLTGYVPVWIPTIVLWIATPLLLGFSDARFSPLKVLSWSLNPVLALFFGGFVLAAAARKSGIDRTIADGALHHAGSSSTRLVSAAALCTAFLAMWMSNVAAAALMFTAFRPIWERVPDVHPLRPSLLLAIALAANVGGISTPIGTGANGIAMAAVAHTQAISFFHWMAFGVPLTIGLVAASVLLIVRRLPPFEAMPPAADGSQAVSSSAANPAQPARKRLGAVFVTTVLLWVSEPLHGIPAWKVALAAPVALLALRTIVWRDFLILDWGTLALVAGGISLGALLDESGIVRDFALWLPIHGASTGGRLFAICLLSAGLSAVMSNTGTAALLIPMAATFDAAPSTAIIVAVASSLGMPFVISTPANAMAVADGLRSRDLLGPGLILMIGGCALIAFTGPWLLHVAGIP